MSENKYRIIINNGLYEPQGLIGVGIFKKFVSFKSVLYSVPVKFSTFKAAEKFLLSFIKKREKEKINTGKVIKYY